LSRRYQQYHITSLKKYIKTRSSNNIS
jgi:hypothetical protein